MRKFSYGDSHRKSNFQAAHHGSYRPHQFDLYLGSVAASEPEPGYSPVYAANSTNATGLPNSPRAGDFRQLMESISRLAALPAYDPMHIDQATSRYAVDLVGLLRGQFDIDAPRMFPQDAEALVLTWDQGFMKRLLTIAGEEVSLLDLNRATQHRCYHDVSDGHEAMADLIPLLAESTSIRSTVLED